MERRDRIELFRGFLGILLITIWMCSSTLALDFDNSVVILDIKDLGSLTPDKERILSKYPPIEIKNSFGLGDTIVKVEIEKHDFDCGNTCESIIKGTNYEKRNILDDIKFYKIEGNKKNRINIPYKLYLGTPKEITKQVYKDTCVVSKTLANGTSEYNCFKEYVKDEIITEYDWTEYENTEIIGDYVLKIEGEKRYSDTIDWIPTIGGKDIVNWAIWNGLSIQTGLIRYYALNESSDPIIDSSDTANATSGTINSGSLNRQQPSQWGYSYNFSGNASGLGKGAFINTTITDIGSGSFSMNFMLNMSKAVVTDNPSTHCHPIYSDWQEATTNGTNICVVKTNSTNYKLQVNRDTSSNPSSAIANITIDGKWQMITITYDNTPTHNQTRIFKDGNEVTYESRQNGTGTFRNGKIGYIGINGVRTTAWYTFTGGIDEIAIWDNRVLNQSDIIYLADYYGILTEPTINSVNYNVSSLERTQQTIILNLNNYNYTIYKIVNVSLFYNNTFYISTTSNNVTFYSVITTPDVSTDTNVSFYWSIVYTNNTQNYSLNSSYYNQTIQAFNLGLCNSTLNYKYLNITFKNETLLKQDVNGSITASIIYYPISILDNSTFNFYNSTGNKEYSLCGNLPDLSINILPTISYYNSESITRSYISPMSLTNSNNLTLWLLPNSLASAVSIQVVSASLSPLSGANVIVNRSGYGTVTSLETDDSGIVTLYLDSTATYIICASKTGYGSSCSTITPTQSTYTITIGSSSTINVPSEYSRGVYYSFTPIGRSLNQSTDYNFSMTINSSYWPLEGYSISVFSIGGNIVGTSSYVGSNPGTVFVIVNTGLNKSLYVKGYYIINGTTVTIGSSAYDIPDLNATTYSIFNLFRRFDSYISSTDGLLGIKKDPNNYNPSLAIIIFILIFSSVGVMGYKYGFNQGFILMSLMTFGVYIFEVAYPIIQIGRFGTYNLPIATIIIAATTLTVGIWEANR